MASTTDRRRSPSPDGRLRDRESVLRAVHELFEHPWGNVGGMLLIEGGPGLGKSALLNTAGVIAAEHGVTVLKARCSEHEIDAPYALVRRLLAPGLEFGAEPFSDDAATWRALDDGDVSPEKLISVFYGLNTILARSGPVAIVVDDAHWADAQSAAWLQFLSARLEIARVHLVVSLLPRPAGVQPAPIDRLALEPTARTFSLRPLSEASTTSIVADRLGDALGKDGPRAAYELTGGNPFLLISLIDAVADLDGPTSVGELTDAASPTVVRWVLWRLAGLPPPALAIVEAAAVLGPDADLRIAAALADIDAETAGDIADAVAAVDVFAGGRPLNFLHPLLQISVYNGTSAAKRSAAHATAAELIAVQGRPVAEVARHLLKTEAQNQPWIVSALSKAARDALNGTDGIGASLRYLERARVEMSPPTESSDFRLAVAEIEARSGRPSAIEQFRVARELDHDVHDWASAGLRLVDRFHGDAPHAMLLVELLTSEGNARDLTPPTRLAVEFVGAVVRSTAPSARSLGTWLEALTPEERRTSVASAAEMYRMLGQCGEPLDNTFAGLVALVEAGVPVPHTDEPESWAVAEVILQTMTLLVRAGAHQVAEPHLRSFRAQMRAAGHDVLCADASIVLAESLIEQGRLSQAEELLSEMMLADLDDDPARHDCVRSAIDELAAIQNDLDSSSPVPTFDDGRPRVGLVVATDLFEMKGRRALRERRWNDALEHFDDAARVATSRGLTNPAVARWQAGRYQALIGLGRIDEATSIAATNLAATRSFGAPVPVAIALRMAAAVAPDDRAVELLEESMSLLDGSVAELERCRTMIALGAAQRRTGDIVAAKRILRGAADLAVRLTAKSLVELASDELRASGARPRRLLLSGLDALTPSERRVVTLAARGLTNVAIASTLFVSLKTVESHLARSYRKLGVKSRSELTIALGVRADDASASRPTAVAG